MKKTLTIFFALFALLTMSGCDQMIARTFGGKITATVPTGEQFLSMTWKDTSLWVLTYSPQTKACYFREQSAVGALQGVVTVPECNPLQVAMTLK